MDLALRELLRQGVVIPACPLAITERRTLDERRERALLRYYIAAGAGGVAVGVHTTQFAIRDPKVALFEPVLSLAAEELNKSGRPLVRVAGICGLTSQAVREAEVAVGLGYHVGLLSLSALKDANEHELVDHCRTVAQIVALFGFYLQPAVGGRVLSYSFWRRFLEIDNVVAIKIAPFSRYQTLDVVRAVADSGRDDVALYTGNDDNIVMDLVTPLWMRSRRTRHAGETETRIKELRIVGGLLGHWAVWTTKAVELLRTCQAVVREQRNIPRDLARQSIEVTDCNAAIFDAANGFAGCIAGVHEVLRRQGLLAGTWCLDPRETLSPGQSEEIDRVYAAYPHLNDDAFVAAHRDEWLRP
jgi:dihydrodipicolinate synthase/N-acetylneuraminate lyase